MDQATLLQPTIPKAAKVRAMGISLYRGGIGGEQEKKNTGLSIWRIVGGVSRELILH